MLNHVTIMGRLTRDPELRHTRSGTAVTSFTLAVDRDFKDKNTGESATDWISCTAWKSVAEFTARYLSRGRLAIVEGRLQSRRYTDKDGNNRTAYEVVASSVYFGDSKRDPLDKLAEDAEPVSDPPISELGENSEDLPF